MYIIYIEALNDICEMAYVCCMQIQLLYIPSI